MLAAWSARCVPSVPAADDQEINSTREQVTQARSASDGTVPSLALRACVNSPRGEYNNRLSCNRAARRLSTPSIARKVFSSGEDVEDSPGIGQGGFAAVGCQGGSRVKVLARDKVLPNIARDLAEPHADFPAGRALCAGV